MPRYQEEQHLVVLATPEKPLAVLLKDLNLHPVHWHYLRRNIFCTVDEWYAYIIIIIYECWICSILQHYCFDRSTWSTFEVAESPSPTLGLSHPGGAKELGGCAAMEVFAFLAKVVALYVYISTSFWLIHHFSTQHHPMNLWSPQAHSLFTGTSVSPAWLRDQRKGASARQLASGLGNGWTMVGWFWDDVGCLEDLEHCHNQGALAAWSRIETWRLSSLGHVKACPTPCDPSNLGLQAVAFEWRSALCARKHVKTLTFNTLNTVITAIGMWDFMRFPWSNGFKGRGVGPLFLPPSWESLVLHLGVTAVTCKTKG